MGNTKNFEKKVSKEQADFLSRLSDLGIEEILGGKDSLSYRLLYELCSMEFTKDFLKEFNTQYADEIPLNRFSEAVTFIVNWFPDDDIFEVSEICEEMFKEYIDKFFDELPKESRAYKQLMEDFINALCTSAKGSD